MVRRPGRSSLGCLVFLLLLAAVVYFGINVGEVYWRYYRYRDAVRQEIRFADRRTDAQVAARLRAKADSLGLPPEAGLVRVRRSGDGVRVRTAYSEFVELPLVVREIRFEIDEPAAP